MREAFLANADVRELSDWLAAHLNALPIRLALPASPFVPGGLKADTTFGALAPTHFRWRLTGMAVGDWWETMQRLHDLSTTLRAAVDANDLPATRAACESIIQWGADRNARVGASAYLTSLGDGLPDYLRRTRDAMLLASPDPTGSFRAVPKMNSSLCKIHALHSFDGLPIYESRVAAAMGVLVELWRRDTGRDKHPLAPALRFPAVGGQLQRRLHRLFPDAADPGLLTYSQGSEIAMAGRWADASVRLGLLTRLILQASDPLLFVAWPDDPLAHRRGARVATFTGALFLAGYDPMCFLPSRRVAEWAVPEPQRTVALDRD